MSREILSEPARVLIERQLDRAINEGPSASGVAEVAKIVSETFEVNPIVEMERRLREIGSDIYLVAVPLTTTNEGFSSRLPHSKEKEYPFYLWVCLYGELEAEVKMAQADSNTAQNLANLAKTGLPCIRPGSELARQVKARLN